MATTTNRSNYRYRVDLHGWLHADGPAWAGPTPARVVDLSRTGACLRVEPTGPVPVGGPVCLALDDAPGGRAVAGRRFGRIVHATELGDEGVRIGLAFDGAGGLLPPALIAELVADPASAGRAGAAGGFDALAVAAAGLALDQASKAWAWSAAAALGGAVDLVPGHLKIDPVANAGALGNLAAEHPGTALACALASVALAARAPGWAAGGRAATLGAGLVAAGLVGNAGDRMALGFVRDFLASPHLAGWTFNLADAFLLLGAGLLAVGGLRTPSSGTP